MDTVFHFRIDFVVKVKKAVVPIFVILSNFVTLNHVMRILYACFLFSLLIPQYSLAQSAAKSKEPSVNFSLQAGTIFPSRLFRVRTNVEESEGISYGIIPAVGAQFGGMAVFSLGKSFRLHGGLMLLMRNYEISADNGLTRRMLQLNTTLYEIPIQLSYYQRLTQRFSLTIGTGVNFQSLPSNLRVRDPEFDVFAQKRAFAMPTSLTTAGIELRGKEKGAYFLGISYCITPFPLYDTGFKATFDGRNFFYNLPHIGDYFCVVGRIYLD